MTPISVLDNISVISNDANGVTVQAQKRSVTIEQIVAAHGARMPSSTDSRKAFAALFVIVSDRLLAQAELGLIAQISENFEKTTGGDELSFAQATGGRATLTTKLPPIAHP